MIMMGFKKYKNTESGVTAYEIEKDCLRVVFSNMVYVYSYNNPGKQHVEKMKELAKQGNGLSTYISQNIKEQYEDKYPLNSKNHDRENKKHT
jgi:hypothetical protein